MAVGFPDPMAAIDAVIACLDMPSNVVVHKGSLGTGETIPCCVSPCGDPQGCGGGVLRVETGETRPLPKDPSVTQQATPFITTGKCGVPLVQDIVVNYRECFPSNTGKAPTPTPVLTAAGVSIVMSWWEALLRIRACSTQTQQRLRFQRREDSVPQGQCAGWTLYLECDIIDCREAPTSQIVGLGMAGESNVTI